MAKYHIAVKLNAKETKLLRGLKNASDSKGYVDSKIVKGTEVELLDSLICKGLIREVTRNLMYQITTVGNLVLKEPAQ